MLIDILGLVNGDICTPWNYVDGNMKKNIKEDNIKM
jgi:hypothetical protein